jgi:hypothetical protein
MSVLLFIDISRPNVGNPAAAGLSFVTFACQGQTPFLLLPRLQPSGTKLVPITDGWLAARSECESGPSCEIKNGSVRMG